MRPHSLLRRLALGVLFLLVVLAAAVVALLPPRAAVSPAAEWKPTWPVVNGAYHVHSARSDGTGTIDEIAAAAARAGLEFVILSDHGDGTRQPEPPSYRSGILVIDGVEVSTEDGHYVALGMAPAPFRLAGRASDVIEDVRRFGGFGIAAHPGSPKPDLHWDDWDAPFDGLEWLNADSEWRDEFWGSLGRVLFTYPFRPTETLTSLLDRPEPVLGEWDRIARRRQVIGLAGADAHARLGYREAREPYQDRVLARAPSYEVSFRAFSNHVVLDGPLRGDAAFDAAHLLDAMRKGRVFTVVDGQGGLGAFEVKAFSGGALARAGEYLDLRGTATIDAQIAAPDGTTVVVLRDGQEIYDAVSRKVAIDVGAEPAVYRIEAHLPGRPRGSIPWLLSNPIYVGLRPVHAATMTVAAPPVTIDRTPIATADWRAESSPGSSSQLSNGALEDGTPALVWRVQLADAQQTDQFAAIWFPPDKRLAVHDRLQLRARADRPMRLWAQLRASADRGGARWAKSFYVGSDLAAIELKLADFRPIGPAPAERPPLDQIDSLLLVVDTVNTAPGTSATISITDLWLVK